MKGVDFESAGDERPSSGSSSFILLITFFFLLSCFVTSPKLSFDDDSPITDSNDAANVLAAAALTAFDRVSIDCTSNDLILSISAVDVMIADTLDNSSNN